MYGDIICDTCRMKAFIASVAVVALLASCSGPGEIKDGPPATPASQTTRHGPTTTEPSAADLAEPLCDAFDSAVTLPNENVITYVQQFNKPTGWASNASICNIEPEDDYFDAAATAGVFGRARADFAVVSENEAQQSKWPEYAPELAAELLTLDQRSRLGDEVPCANDPCHNGIHGYQYNYWFETSVSSRNFVVSAEFDYFTTDISGDQQDHYRKKAIKAFNTAMTAMLDELP